jgi:uncharacterized Fe-S cluster-containing MiaB family protein
VDPWRAHGSLVEPERRPDGNVEHALTVFLAGAECPFTCSFCDLWRWTTDGPTPPGALPAQLEAVLGELGERVAPVRRLKLYNASNFFDRRAVPLEDVPTLATLAAPFAGVTVESHANTVGDLTLELRDLLAGRLEVAMWLESIHPAAVASINKRLDLPRFDAAARFLADHGVDLRVFVILGLPHVPAAESVEWTVRAVAYAVERGASVVSIIPARGGNGEMDRLASLGAFTPPTLAQLEESLDCSLTLAPAVVTADLWDVERLATCGACRAARCARLERINLTGRAEARVACAQCGA